MLDLTPSEAASLLALDTVREGWHLRRLQQAFEKWEKLATELETTGYQHSDNVYANDLDSRRTLEEMMALVPDLAPKLEALIAPIDERFRRATRVVEEPLSGSVINRREIPRNEIRWWNFRYPIKRDWDLDPIAYFNFMNLKEE